MEARGRVVRSGQGHRGSKGGGGPLVLHKGPCLKHSPPSFRGLPSALGVLPCNLTWPCQRPPCTPALVVCLPSPSLQSLPCPLPCKVPLLPSPPPVPVVGPHACATLQH